VPHRSTRWKSISFPWRPLPRKGPVQANSFAGRLRGPASQSDLTRTGEPGARNQNAPGNRPLFKRRTPAARFQLVDKHGEFARRAHRTAISCLACWVSGSSKQSEIRFPGHSLRAAANANVPASINQFRSLPCMAPADSLDFLDHSVGPGINAIILSAPPTFSGQFRAQGPGARRPCRSTLATRVSPLSR